MNVSILDFHYKMVQQSPGGDTTPSSDPASEGSGSFSRKARTCLLDHEHISGKMSKSDCEDPHAAEGWGWRDGGIFAEVGTI